VREAGRFPFPARRRPPCLLSEGAGGTRRPQTTAPAIRSGGGRHVCSEGANSAVCLISKAAIAIPLVIACVVAGCFEDKKEAAKPYWDTYQQRATEWRNCMNNLAGISPLCDKYKALMDQPETEYRLRAAQ
jgi:hypothetical protein